MIEDIYINIADRALVNLMQPKVQSTLVRNHHYKDIIQLLNLKNIQKKIKTMIWNDIKNDKNICKVIQLALTKIEILNHEIFTSNILTDIQYMDNCLNEWLK